MGTTPLILGPVVFANFEIPERLSFGGKQALAVHRLPGGVRVIDAMGRDDADLRWSGTLSGAEASIRARMLDTLRASGAPLILTWDTFFYTVIVAQIDFDYANPAWIPYRIVCTVVQDEIAALVDTVISISASILSDLADASGVFDLSPAEAAIGVDGATTPGTAAYAQAVTSLNTANNGIAAGVTQSESLLTTSDLGQAVTASGQLAQFCSARGFVARASMNLLGINGS